MYRSKLQIENKLKQVNYINNEIQKFRNRIFVNDGVDPDTGAHPLLTHISSFITHARSVIQYAFKEAKNGGKEALYSDYVKNIGVFKIFKDARNSDIHEYTVAVSTVMSGSSPLDPSTMQNGVIKGKVLRFFVEDISDLNNPSISKSDIRTTYSLRQRLDVTSELIDELKQNSQQEILDAIDEGKDIFDEKELDGNSDIHSLCDIYILELNKFIEYGTKHEFIS